MPVTSLFHSTSSVSMCRSKLISYVHFCYYPFSFASTLNGDQWSQVWFWRHGCRWLSRLPSDIVMQSLIRFKKIYIHIFICQCFEVQVTSQESWRNWKAPEFCKCSVNCSVCFYVKEVERELLSMWKLVFVSLKRDFFLNYYYDTANVCMTKTGIEEIH